MAGGTGYTSQYCATSPDGVTWTLRNMPSNGYWLDTVWNGTVWCAVCGGPTNMAATSPDGITWTQRTLPVTAAWYSIAWNGSVFCTVFNNTAVSATSPDGITWNSTAALPAANTVTSLGTKFIAVGPNATPASSTDGMKWTLSTTPTGTQNYSTAASSSTKTFILVSGGSGGMTTDGTNYGPFGKYSIQGGVFNGSLYCVPITNTSMALTSTDGVTWTARLMSASSSWTAIAYGAGIFCALGSMNVGANSTDGITWTATSPALPGYATGMAYGAGVFCAIYNSVTSCYTSTDGVIWTQRSLPTSTSQSWSSIVWNGTVFCAIASSTNYCATSPDGINWTLRALPISSSWYFLTWNGSVFIATTVSNGSIAATSPDGIVWTQRTLTSLATPANGYVPIANTATGDIFLLGNGVGGKITIDNTKLEVPVSLDGGLVQLISWS